MQTIIRKLVLANAIALTCAGIATSATASPKPHETVTEQMTDARREVQISTSYTINRHLRDCTLTVNVDGNRAILSGKVENSIEKDLAEQIALGVDGITRVDNNINIQTDYMPAKRVNADRNFSEKVDDATITASVKSKLLWNSHTDGLDIHVDTNNGKVTLTGNADNNAEKDLAGRIARNTNSVVGLSNQIAVTGKPDADDKAKAAVKTTAKETEQTVSDSWITAKVKSTLMFSRNVEGLEITVTTNKGIVSLTGDVETAGERDLAIELTQNIRGVKKVDASGLKVS